MFEQHISGPGRYYQKGQGSRLSRIEFQFGTEDSAVQLNQLCDGDFLYNLTTAYGKSNLEFVDLRQLNSTTNVDEPDLSSWLSVGSLAGLMQQLSRHFEFSAPVQEQLDGIPVIKLVGQWKQPALARLMEGQVDAAHFENGIAWSALPKHLPHRVRLTLGNEQQFPLFPYQIIFDQFETVSGKQVARPIVTLELFEVELADDLPDKMFALPSTDARPNDATEFYRNRIKQFTRQ